jgi:hypothetical protein
MILFNGFYTLSLTTTDNFEAKSNGDVEEKTFVKID